MICKIWEIDFGLYDYDRFAGGIIFGDKFYQKVTEDQGTALTRVHLLEIDIHTGDFIKFVSYGVVTPLLGISPPVFFQDNVGKDIIIFNQYPDIELPQEREQNITAIDMETKEVLWVTENFTEGFASNGGHPPIIYQDLVITGGDWSMYAFDIHTGVPKWETPIAPESPFGNWNNTNHLIHDGRLYVNDTGNHLTCLNPLTGEFIWDSTNAPNCTDNMLYYEKEDYLVFTSWGYGSVMILDALTGENIHREHRYDDSQYNNDVVYDEELDMFFTSTYKHVVGFKINAPE